MDFYKVTGESGAVVVFQGGTPPENAEEITAEEFRQAFEIVPQTITLDELKRDLKAHVDGLAEVERLKYITPGNGQMLTYQQKVAEAQALQSATNPDHENYPLLSAEVGITAPTVEGVADVVLAAYAQWQQIGAAIEAVRLGGKAAIEAAEKSADAQAAYDAIVWPEG